eukprot:XP_025002056.1 leukocyte immunoglobulin-like receptor subfamily A member 2 [Gallus gallus]
MGYYVICPHQEVTSYRPEKERGTDSSSPATSFTLCSRTVHNLLLPHGTNGRGPHSRLVAGDSEQGTAITLQEHAGRYWCQYQVSWAEEASEKSDPVELVLTDHSYSPPSISIHPEQCVEMGTNITIRCRNKDYGAAFLLHKDGSSPPIKHQDPSGGGAANFTFLAVTPADSGTYRCSYRPRGYPFVSSPLGDSVMLEVTPTVLRSSLVPIW